MSDRESRTGRTALALGGGALLAWLLLRGAGWLPGRGHGAGGDGPTRPRPAGPPCRVHLDEDGIELDGVRSDLPRTVSRCRVAGIAEVTATGAAIVGAIGEVLTLLRDAGVIVRASPDLWDVAGLATSARSAR